MNAHEEFLKAYNNFPSQDNEGYVPDRAGFKCGFHAAYSLLSEENVKLKAELENLNKYWKWGSEARWIEGYFKVIRDRAALLAEKEMWGNEFTAVIILKDRIEKLREAFYDLHFYPCSACDENMAVRDKALADDDKGKIKVNDKNE